MTSLRLPLFDEIEEQVAVVVDHARADELTKWVDWLDSKIDKITADINSGRMGTHNATLTLGGRLASLKDVAHELRRARDGILDALAGQASA